VRAHARALSVATEIRPDRQRWMASNCALFKDGSSTHGSPLIFYQALGGLAPGELHFFHLQSASTPMEIAVSHLVLVTGALWVGILLLLARHGSIAQQNRELTKEELVGPPAIVLTLVHGTFARRATWPRYGSPLRKRIAFLLAGHVVFRELSWSGYNTFRARMAGTTCLRELLLENLTKWPTARHFILGHSHGGSIALDTLRDPELAERIDGVVCLSTPFLVTSDLNVPKVFVELPVVYGYFCAGAICLACAAGWFYLSPDSFNSYLKMILDHDIYHSKYIVMQTLLPFLFITALAWVTGKAFHKLSRHYAGVVLQTRRRTCIPPERVLILRQPGDEASAVIGGAHLLSWLIVNALNLLLATVIVAQNAWDAISPTSPKALWRSRLGFICVSIVVVIAAYLINPTASALGAYVSTNTSLLGTITITSLVVTVYAITGIALIYILAFIVMGVFCFLVMLPYALFIGPELLFVGPKIQVTAEATPHGSWNVHSLDLGDLSNEADNHRGRLGAMTHSYLYDSVEATKIIIDWIRHKCIERGLP
jgi:pimeloyl-ACP methyl ester carboxylesterase